MILTDADKTQIGADSRRSNPELSHCHSGLAVPFKTWKQE